MSQQAAPATYPADDALAPSQRARRDRILWAARDLAAAGGFDGVQMRDVAEDAEVALGTLYRYFPSKVHLLVGLLHHETRTLAERLEQRPVQGDSAAERAMTLLDRGTRALRREPALAEAMFRALMFADTTAATEVRAVNQLTMAILVDAIRGPDDVRIADEEAIAKVLSQVWLSSLLAWLSGRMSDDQLDDDLADATRLLLG